MSGHGTPAIAAAERARIAFRVHEYAHQPSATSYGLEAVAALGVPPERVFKTLLATVDEFRLVVAVVPVASRLNLKALALALKVKRATMADPHLAERSTGYVVGGISPLGQKKLLPTVVDAQASRFETVFVSAGRRGLEIELAPADLLRLTRATLAAIAD